MKNFLTFPFEVKAVGDDGNLEGYASTFGNVDLGYDVVERGAFKKTLKESKGRFPILADHWPDQQIGWNISAEEDEKGLMVKGWLDIGNNVKAKEKSSMAKKGLELNAKVGLSIGYQTVKYEIDKTVTEGPVLRRLKEVKLLEYSLVTFPMNTAALVTAAKNWAEHFSSKETCPKKTLELFIETMLEKGYSDEEVNKALGEIRAAKTQENPDDSIVQFLREQADSFKNRLRA